MSERQENNEDDTVYFKLLEAVGVRGCYQVLLILLTIVLALPNGVVSLGSSTSFAVPSYTECPPPHSGIALCTKYACSLPPSQRKQYEQKEIQHLQSIGTQFGDYHCDKRDSVEQAKGTYFMGAMAGYLIVGMIADNFGRRVSMIFCLSVGIAGYVVMLLSASLTMAGVGYFIVGFATQNIFNLNMCYLAEMLDNERRQKMQTLVQAWVPVGAILHILGFMLFQEWRIVFVILCLIPVSIALIFTCLFLIDTPLFLVKLMEVGEIRQNLRFIARFNDTEENFQRSPLLTRAHILDLKEEFAAELAAEHEVKFTFIDLFWFPSLRWITICALVYCFCTNVLYYLPQTLTGQLGFNFYLNGLVVNGSDLTTYLLTYNLITRVRRRVLNVTASLVALVSSFTLIFVHNCNGDHCTSSQGLSMVLLFFMRFAGGILNQIMSVYTAELFPIQVRGMAISLCCLFGMLPNTFLPELVHLMNKANINVMILGSVIAVVAIVASWAAPETLGVPPKERVEEIHHGTHHSPHLFKEEFNELPEEQL